MGSSFGRYFSMHTFGESHGPAVGVIVDGVPPGIAVDGPRIQHELDRRRPGTSAYVSPRKELDRVEILSGIVDGTTIGSPIMLLVRNKDARSRDYKEIGELFRPGHADYTYFKKYGIPPQPGGGRASGRETVGRVAGGAIAKALIEPRGMQVRAYTLSVGGLRARQIDLDFAEKHPLRVPDPEMADEMAALVDSVRSEGDSIGGIVEVLATGVSAGLGDPVFHKLEAELGRAMLSIGAVKGIEFGAGFALAGMRGSEANDPILSEGFASNHAGGTLGGISTGQTIVMRLAVKPTASISRPQKTVDIHGHDSTIQVKGRHDPFLCPRICPVAEAMAAITLADALLEQIAHQRF